MPGGWEEAHTWLVLDPYSARTRPALGSYLAHLPHKLAHCSRPRCPGLRARGRPRRSAGAGACLPVAAAAASRQPTRAMSGDVVESPLRTVRVVSARPSSGAILQQRELQRGDRRGRTSVHAAVEVERLGAPNGCAPGGGGQTATTAEGRPTSDCVPRTAQIVENPRATAEGNFLAKTNKHMSINLFV